jgi:hypothetical protein
MPILFLGYSQHRTGFVDLEQLFKNKAVKIAKLWENIHDASSYFLLSIKVFLLAETLEKLILCFCYLSVFILIQNMVHCKS